MDDDDYLMTEHQKWSEILGRIFVEALQGSHDYCDSLAKEWPIHCTGGIPCIESPALRRKEKEERDFDLLGQGLVQACIDENEKRKRDDQKTF